MAGLEFCRGALCERWTVTDHHYRSGRRAQLAFAIVLVGRGARAIRAHVSSNEPYSAESGVGAVPLDYSIGGVLGHIHGGVWTPHSRFAGAALAHRAHHSPFTVSLCNDEPWC